MTSRRRSLVKDTLVEAIKAGLLLGLLPSRSEADSGGSQAAAVRSGVLDVKAAGALGDGQSDDTNAFRRALEASHAVFVPPGTYRLTATIDLTGATLVGTGPRSILRSDSQTDCLIRVSGAGARLRQLALQGTAVDETTAQFAIMTSPDLTTDDFCVNDVRVSGFNNGIKFADPARNCRVESCHFSLLIGSSSGRGYGVLTGAVDGLIVCGNVFEGSRVTRQGRHAVYVSAGGRRVIATHNLAREFSSEAFCTNAYAHQNPVEDLMFANNVVHRCGGDGANQSSISITGKARTVRVEGNIVVDSFGCGILCDAGSVRQEDVNVSGNTVVDSAYMGIGQVGALQQTVRDNYVRGSSRKEAQRWADIVVGGGVLEVEQIFVSGNQCVPVPGASFRAFVLNVAKAVPASVTISGNDFPTLGYASAPDFGSKVVPARIDGRIQFQQQWRPASLAPGAATVATFEVLGAEIGDVVACSHPSVTGGLVLAGAVTASNKVTVTLVNHSPGIVALRGGLVRVDVWKRNNGSL